tara:strand:+ start:2479 stop:2910 length:432 start_codon:yes stop_codon:yes gene_type:complete
MKNSKKLVNTLVFLGVFLANTAYSTDSGINLDNDISISTDNLNKPINSNEWMLQIIDNDNFYDYNAKYNLKKIKLHTVLLAITLGPFGVHRLYLGTDAKVPVVYTLTLGGGLGILPLIDVIATLATNDISQFQNNEKIVMWAK